MRRRKREAHEPGIGYAATLREGADELAPSRPPTCCAHVGGLQSKSMERLSRLCGRRNVVSIVTPPRTGGKHALWSARYPTRCATAPQRRSRARKDGTHSTGIAPSGPRRCLVGWPSSICNRPFELAYGMGRRSVLDIQLSLAELADAELIAITRCQVT